MKFSVIVPCYNVERYLDECVESILSQECQDFELLLIDDGSTDGTSRLCDVWGSKDEKVRVFHKTNGGLSAARNYGIDRSTGDYLIFIDSDDFIKKESFAAIAECMKNNPEIIITRLVEYYNEDDIQERDADMSELISVYPTMEEAVKWEVSKSYNSWPAPKKILSRNFVEENNLRFKEGYLHEDMDWTVRVLLVGKEYATCAYPWYYHRMLRIGSITNTVKAKSITDVIKMAGELTSLCEKSEHPCNGEIENRIISSLFVSINKYGKLQKEERKEVINCLTENKYLLTKAKKPIHRAFAAACNVIGVKNALKLIGL